MSVINFARRLVERGPHHRVISLYLDLDPAQFATPPARETQVHSLIDGVGPEVEADDSLSHHDRITLREDLERLREYLVSDEPPFQGARALGVFVSGRDELFETVQIAHPVEGRVAIGKRPYIEPLVAGAQARRWCVALVSGHDARVFTGTPATLAERERIGLQERLEEADSHLRHVADLLAQRWQQERFELLALGGEQDVVPRFAELLSQDLRRRLVDRRVEVDMSYSNDEQVRQAVAAVVEQEEQERERAALDRLNQGLGSGGRAAGGVEATLKALNERRVEVLLLEQGVRRAGGRCPSDGLLTASSSGTCPADGAEIEPVEDLGEAVVEAALLQDAELIVVSRYPDLGPYQGFAALLRF